MKKYKIINNIKKFKEIPINANWLNSGQKALKSFIAENPVRNYVMDRHSRQERIFKKLIFKPMPIAIFTIIASLITGGVVTASQNSLPTDKLYPVKLMVEKVEEIATFNNVKKIELQTKLAEKRLEEIKDLQVEGKANKEIVEENLQKYENNLTKAQEYLVDINTNSNFPSPKILAASINLEKAVNNQQVTMSTIEEEASPEYKATLAKGREKALNNSSQSLEKVRIEINATESAESIISNEMEIEDKNESRETFNKTFPNQIVSGSERQSIPSITQSLISENEAMKIAAKAGLEEGIEEWKVKLYWYYGKINNYVWSISNRISEFKGQTVIINASSGEVYEILDQVTIPISPSYKEKTDSVLSESKPIVCPLYIDCMPTIIDSSSPVKEVRSCQVPIGCEEITQIVY